MQTKHGVLTAKGLLRIDGKDWKEIPMVMREEITLSAICELAAHSKFTHLWIWPDLGLALDETFFDQAREGWDLWPNWTIDEKIAQDTGETRQLISVTGCRKPKGGQAWFTLIFPENCAWTFCDEDLTPRKLLQTISIMEKELKIPVGGGPTTCGTKLLEQANFAHMTWLDPPAADLPVEELKSAAREIIWPGAGAIEIPEWARFIIKIDKNSAYLKACTATVFGSGTITHVFHGQGIEEGRVGVWYTLINAWPSRPGLPPIAREPEGWFTGPMIKLLRDTGHTISVEEGWQFDLPADQKSNHRILAKWAGDIFDARIKFRRAKKMAAKPFERDCYENAEYAMKDIATSTVGLFSSDKLAEENKKLWLEKKRRIWKYRPDWHTQALAMHAVLMHYNIIKIAELCQLQLAMVYMDALFYFSASADVAEILSSAVTLDADKIGAYKLEWAQSLTPEIREILSSGEAINIKIGALNDLAEEKE